MAVTLASQQPLLGPYPPLPLTAGEATVNWSNTASGTSWSAAIVETKTVIMAKNASTGACTITFTSVPDGQNRTGDISAYSLSAGAIAMFGPFQASGWSNGGNLTIGTNDTNVQLANVTLP